MSDLIKVSATSQTTAVAGAIAGIIRERHSVAVQAIGASAVNQAVKAIAIAHGYLEDDRLDIWCLPSFVQVDVSGLERTAVRFSVVVRGTPGSPPTRPDLVSGAAADGADMAPPVAESDDDTFEDEADEAPFG